MAGFKSESVAGLRRNSHLVFSRFGYSYLQPVAARHGIKAEKKEHNGYTSRDLDTPLRKWVDAQGKEGKLRFVFEVA